MSEPPARDRARIRVDRVRATASFYGAQRADRPSDIRDPAVVCPFCPGNESLTGGLLTADPGLGWESRVIANLYPAVVEPDGRHEVIVETRAHDARWTQLEPATIERILEVYREREAAGYAEGYGFVAIFKNSGAGSGASLAHPHAQVVALRTIPPAIAARVDRLTSTCEVCRAFDDRSKRVIERFGAVVAYVPDVARLAFEVRIGPVAHAGRFSECPAGTLRAVAEAVSSMLKRLASIFGEDVPFNMIVQSAPADRCARMLQHWEIELIPRRENFGGFELGMGGFLVSRPPEDVAARLRAADVGAHA
jgi:UDPglucose--hexose-1-phosphate uridylyltransferase